MRRAMLFPAVVLALSAACSETTVNVVPRHAGDADDEHELTPQGEVVMRSLPALVLLLNTKADGSIGYGSGLIVDHQGLVLTALHVAEGGKLGAMLYRKDRVSYTPMDGGLGRYIFENQREIVGATLVARDPTADLALVKLAVPTPDAPILSFAHGKVAAGDRVLALGHPQETVWSFTSGVVSALHHGAIQHDATLSSGSSGGPLLNEAGEVIGINTSKVVNEARGLSFARPADIAQRLVATGGEDEAEVDRSTPEKAIQGCWHARELASPSVASCVDWDAQFKAYGAALDDLRRRGLTGVAARAAAATEKAGGRDAWIDARKHEMAKWTREGMPKLEWEPPPGAPGDVTRAFADLRASSERQRAVRVAKNGLQGEIADGKAMQERHRMGLRIDEVREVSPGVAWAAISGRNPDGTLYRLSDCWIKVDDAWVERLSPTPDDVKRVPAGWPPPLDDFAHGVEREAMGLLVRASAPAAGGGADAARSIR